jgi:hypothetical protein
VSSDDQAVSNLQELPPDKTPRPSLQRRAESKSEKKAKRSLKAVALPRPPTPHEENLKNLQKPQAPQEPSSSYTLIELAHHLQEKTRTQGPGMNTYAEAINRVKRVGTSKKGIILDEDVE